MAALDDVPAMRGVLCLFEGVVTGAADGYGRVAGRPAATLLHLGPGLGNGLANLHNARRARTPVVNIVGDHATYHARYDAPAPVRHRVHRRRGLGVVPLDGPGRRRGRRRRRRGGRRAGPAGLRRHPGPAGGLVVVGVRRRALPATAARTAGRRCRPTRSTRWPRRCARASGPRCSSAARALRADGLHAASRVAATTGAALLGETFPANLERGAGIPAVERLAYLAEMAQAQLDGVRHLVLVDAKSPVSFFAYPDKASDLVPAGLHRAHPGPARARTPPAPSRRWPRRVGAPADAGVPAPSGRPERPAGRPHDRVAGGRRRAPRCPRAPSSSTRATRRASSSPGRRRARRATTG